jgi:hypothetical protein
MAAVLCPWREYSLVTAGQCQHTLAAVCIGSSQTWLLVVLVRQRRRAAEGVKAQCGAHRLSGYCWCHAPTAGVLYHSFFDVNAESRVGHYDASCNMLCQEWMWGSFQDLKG